MLSTTNVAVTMFWISLLRWLTVMTPALAAVLAESGPLGEETTTVAEEGLNLLPGESMSSRVKREYTNNRAARRRVFKQTDLNGDGLVTRKEYVMKNGNMTTEELDILFGAFDVDGDRSLSQDEFVRHGFLWVVVEECELEAIERCDEEFVRLIRSDQSRGDGEQQNMLCTAFQTYFDCIEHEQLTCDITAYSQAVVDLVATYRTINFCPDLDFAGLFSLPDAGGPTDNDHISNDDAGIDEDMASEMLSSDLDVDMDIGGDEAMIGYRAKRTAYNAPKHHPFKFPWSGLGFDFTDWTTTTTDHPDATDNDVASCTSLALSSCTGSLHDELRRNPYDGLCDSLSDYRHCVSRHARRCPEFELVEVEDRLRKLLQFHQKMGLC